MKIETFVTIIGVTLLLTILVIIVTPKYTNAAPPQIAEYGIRKTYDEDAICYTAFMKNGLETGLSISCIPRPQSCTSQNEKGDKLYAEISNKTVSHNPQRGGRY